jgi:thiamine biosynthesis protein ThiS
MGTFRIQLNGEPHPVESGTTVADLVLALGRHPQTVAIELNGTILPRARFATQPLQAGDQLEIVHFVQGGVDIPTPTSV